MRLGYLRRCFRFHLARWWPWLRTGGLWSSWTTGRWSCTWTQRRTSVSGAALDPYLECFTARYPGPRAVDRDRKLTLRNEAPIDGTGLDPDTCRLPPDERTDFVGSPRLGWQLDCPAVTSVDEAAYVVPGTSICHQKRATNTHDEAQCTDHDNEAKDGRDPSGGIDLDRAHPPKSGVRGEDMTSSWIRSMVGGLPRHQTCILPLLDGRAHRSGMPATSRPTRSAVQSVSLAGGDPDHCLRGHGPGVLGARPSLVRLRLWDGHGHTDCRRRSLAAPWWCRSPR